MKLNKFIEDLIISPKKDAIVKEIVKAIPTNVNYTYLGKGSDGEYYFTVGSEMDYEILHDNLLNMESELVDSTEVINQHTDPDDYEAKDIVVIPNFTKINKFIN